MTSTTITATGTADTINPRPYPPSWVDRFTAWLDRLSVPSGVIYFIILFLHFTILHIADWVEGVLPMEQFNLLMNDPVYTVYYLAYIHYLDGAAANALRAFRPAMNITDAEFERLRYELTTMPRKTVRWLAVLGTVLTLFGVPYALMQGDRTVPYLVVTNLSDAITSAIIFTFFYHTARQLRMVSRIYSSMTQVNLYRRTPVYAFSGLTARTGIGYIFPIYFDVLNQRQMGNTDPLTAIPFTFLLLAGAAFIVPLLGIHRMLAEEKERLESAIGQRIEAVTAELHQKVDGRDLEDMLKLQAALNALIAEENQVGKIPTWPWAPGTLRGFLTALLLPLAVWLLQTLAQRFIGL